MSTIATEPAETPETPRLMTLAETAQRLGVSRATMYRLVGSGELPAVRVGGSLRVDPGELRAYVFGPEPEAPETADDVELDEFSEILGRDEAWIRSAEARPGGPRAIVSASGRLRVRREHLAEWRAASGAEA